MINRSALFIAALILVLVSVCNAQTMIEMKEQAGAEYKKADAEMNRFYKMARDSCDDAGKERLKKVQLQWIKYRDLCCEAEAAIYEGGSMSGLVFTNCMKALTEERTARLKQYDVENFWK